MVAPVDLSCPALTLPRTAGKEDGSIFDAAQDSRMTTVEPIRRVKIYQEIARRLEKQVLDGALRPGDALPSERELMERYGVGRPAVREALLSLEKAGLIAIQNGERARVIQPSAANLIDELGSAARYLLHRSEGARHFQQARLFFEVGLVRHAAEHATEDDLARLGQALEANEAALGDLERFAKTDVEFHFVLAEIPRNPIFVALHVGLAEWLTEQRSTTLLVKGAARTALKAHKEIHAAIKARDAAGAEDAMRRHLLDVEARYWRVKDRTPASAPVDDASRAR